MSLETTTPNQPASHPPTSTTFSNTEKEIFQQKRKPPAKKPNGVQ